MLKLAFLFVMSFNTKANSTEWLSLLRDGKDQEAAASISNEAAKLRLPITFAEKHQALSEAGDWGNDAKKTFFDSGYVGLLNRTAESLNSDCNCDEKLKFTVFRGFRPNQTDFNVGSDKRPLILSRGLHNKGLLDEKKMFTSGKTPISGLMSRHANGHREDSLFISTSYSTEIANLSPQIMVLRICPSRLIQNHNSTYPGEYELLIPFFIHPTELVAIIEPEKNGKQVSSGSFKILHQYGYLSQVSEKTAHTEIQRLAVDNMSYIKTHGQTQFGYFFEELRNRRVQKEKVGRSCRSILSN